MERQTRTCVFISCSDFVLEPIAPGRPGRRSSLQLQTCLFTPVLTGCRCVVPAALCSQTETRRTTESVLDRRVFTLKNSSFFSVSIVVYVSVCALGPTEEEKLVQIGLDFFNFPQLNCI